MHHRDPHHPDGGAPRLDDTKALLIAAATRHFGRHGFEAASLRAVVQEAGQNVSAVKYHFGSKQGLYDACVRSAARRLKAEGPGVILQAEAPSSPAATPEAARAMIRRIVEAALRDGLRPEIADERRFLYREIVLGGRGADIFYDDVLRDHVEFFARLLVAAEELDLDSARLRALGVMMQTVVYMSAGSVIALATGRPLSVDRIPAVIDAIYPATGSDPVA